MIIMMIFNMLTSYFHKILFHYFGDYLMTKLTLGQGIFSVEFRNFVTQQSVVR
jgi:hypothetical protein